VPERTALAFLLLLLLLLVLQFLLLQFFLLQFLLGSPSPPQARLRHRVKKSCAMSSMAYYASAIFSAGRTFTVVDAPMGLRILLLLLRLRNHKIENVFPRQVTEAVALSFTYG
jgi:hypothetical protein